MRTDPSCAPMTPYPPFLFAWLTAQFPARGLHVFFKERAPGDSIYVSGEQTFGFERRAEAGQRLTSVRHEIEWDDDPLGQTVRTAHLWLGFADGCTRELQVRTLLARYYLKGGLYGGLNGWFHGDDKGPLHIEHDQWNLADPEHRRLARTLCDHVVEVREGDEIGWGIMEYGVAAGYPQYTAVQRHPPI
jgi:hypothetical protein